MTPAHRALRTRLVIIAAFFALAWLGAMTKRDVPMIWDLSMRGLVAGVPALALSTWFAVRRAYRGEPVDGVKETTIPIAMFIGLFVFSGWLT